MSLNVSNDVERIVPVVPARHHRRKRGEEKGQASESIVSRAERVRRERQADALIAVMGKLTMGSLYSSQLQHPSTR